jgi:hypothetical protein
MFDFHHRTRAPRWVAAGAAVLLSLSACGDDETAGPETGADVGDVVEEDGSFKVDEYKGQTVTVSAEIEDMLSPKSFVLSGGQQGDDRLLVLTEQPTDLDEGEVVQVTGTVETFTYDHFADRYGLTEPAVYQPYGDEEFIAASKVDKSVDTQSPATPTAG